MKNICIALTILSLGIFSGCAKTEDIKVENETPVEVTAVEEVEEAKPEENNISGANPAEIQGEIVTGEYKFDDFSLTLADEWLEVSEAVDGDFGIRELVSDKGINLRITTVDNSDREINSKSISEEVSIDGYFHIEEETQVDSQDGTTFYGAFISDEATSAQICYYISKLDSKVVSLMFRKKISYTKEEIELIHEVLGSFKVEQ